MLVNEDLIFAIFLPSIWILLKPIISIGVLPAVPAVVYGLIRGSSVKVISDAAVAMMAIGSGSTAVGYLAGASRETVAGDVLPVVLTGLGGLGLYAVVEKKIDVKMASAVAIVVSLWTLAGMILGSTFREYGAPNFQTYQPPFGTGQIDS